MILDSYHTLSSTGEALYTEKRSRFYAFAMHVANENEVKIYVAEFRKKYYDARHVCYAYVLGKDGEQTRVTDDGEPSGSAGKPILGQLRSSNLTYTLIVVVRYFGGIKLGTGGLSVAYKTAAAAALAAATIEEQFIKTTVSIMIPYSEVNKVMRITKEEEADILERTYEATTISLKLSVRLNSEERLRCRLSSIFTLIFI